MKVLIVDDSPDALRVAAARLKPENLDIVCAEGGAEGLELARREKPDLILLDVDMPELSGFEVCHALKNDAELHMIPVIFLSGSTTGQDKIKGLDLGAVDYVTKPFDKFELRARVRAALRTKHLQDLLAARAQTDSLTGLANRRGITERLHQEWACIRRYGGEMSFIMADIDHFKSINDTYGHGTGDKLLQQVAGAIAAQCREMDLPARYGGDEFAILVPYQSAANAGRLAERCRQAIEKTSLQAGNQVIGQAASFGTADTMLAESVDALIQAADQALYQAKQAGGNTVVIDAEAKHPPPSIRA